MKTCRHCHEEKTEDPKIWHSKNVCIKCWKERSVSQWHVSKERRFEQAALDDPLIEPARVRVDMSCG